jgi:hypothetical protein
MGVVIEQGNTACVGVYLGVAVSADARLTQPHFCSKDLLCLGITDGFVMCAERCGVFRGKTPV